MQPTFKTEFAILLSFVTLLSLTGCRDSSFSGEWISAPDEFSFSHLVISKSDGDVLVKIITADKYAEFDSSVLYKGIDKCRYALGEDTLTILQKNADQVSITSSENGNTFIMVPFGHFNLADKIEQVRHILGGSIVTSRFDDRTYIVELSRNWVGVDNESDFIHQWDLIAHESELFYVPDVWGPLLHIKDLDSTRVIGVVYVKGEAKEVEFELKKSAHDKFIQPFIGKWTKSHPQNRPDILPCHVVEDTLELSRDTYWRRTFCKKSNGQWDAYLNGMFLVFHEWDSVKNEYRKPNKNEVIKIDKEVLVLAYNEYQVERLDTFRRLEPARGSE